MDETSDNVHLTPQEVVAAFNAAKARYRLEGVAINVSDALAQPAAPQDGQQPAAAQDGEQPVQAESIKVAVAQFAASNVVLTNIDYIVKFTCEAADAGADLVVFPEAAMIRFHATIEHLQRTARDIEPTFRQELAKLAKAANIAMVCGIMQASPKADDPRVVNALLVLDREGREQYCYQKIHLYDAFAFQESERVQPGDPSQLPLVNVGGFQMGLINCYDLRFPEAARRLALAGADVLVVSAAWVQGSDKEAHWDILCKARAIENTCFVLASGQTPKRCCGHSMILDPMGNVLAGATTEPSVIVQTLKRERLKAVRELMPCLQNVRLNK